MSSEETLSTNISAETPKAGTDPGNLGELSQMAAGSRERQFACSGRNRPGTSGAEILGQSRWFAQRRLMPRAFRAF